MPWRPAPRPAAPTPLTKVSAPRGTTALLGPEEEGKDGLEDEAGDRTVLRFPRACLLQGSTLRGAVSPAWQPGQGALLVGAPSPKVMEGGNRPAVPKGRRGSVASPQTGCKAQPPACPRWARGGLHCTRLLEKCPLSKAGLRPELRVQEVITGGDKATALSWQGWCRPLTRDGPCPEVLVRTADGGPGPGGATGLQ